jgi:hypothetical protein
MRSSVPSQEPATAKAKDSTIAPRTGHKGPPKGKVGPPLTSCRHLIDTGWVAPIAEPEISYNPGSGIATIILGDETLHLDVLHDEACRRVPTIGPLVRSVRADAAEID